MIIGRRVVICYPLWPRDSIVFMALQYPHCIDAHLAHSMAAQAVHLICSRRPRVLSVPLLVHRITPSPVTTSIILPLPWISRFWRSEDQIHVQCVHVMMQVCMYLAEDDPGDVLCARRKGQRTHVFVVLVRTFLQALTLDGPNWNLCLFIHGTFLLRKLFQMIFQLHIRTHNQEK